MLTNLWGRLAFMSRQSTSDCADWSRVLLELSRDIVPERESRPHYNQASGPRLGTVRLRLRRSVSGVLTYDWTKNGGQVKVPSQKDSHLTDVRLERECAVEIEYPETLADYDSDAVVNLVRDPSTWEKKGRQPVPIGKIRVNLYDAGCPPVGTDQVFGMRLIL